MPGGWRRDPAPPLMRGRSTGEAEEPVIRRRRWRECTGTYPCRVKAIQIEEFGGPELLKPVEVPDPEASGGEVVVDVARSGMNFADNHAIRTDYLAEQTLPLIPGGEVSGTTPDGRRVAAILQSGGYAQKVAVPEPWLVPLPDEVSDDQAAALLLQGLTAWHLFRTSAKLAEGESVVVISGAGGVGSLAVQLAKPFGAGTGREPANVANIHVWGKIKRWTRMPKPNVARAR